MATKRNDINELARRTRRGLQSNQANQGGNGSGQAGGRLDLPPPSMPVTGTGAGGPSDISCPNLFYNPEGLLDTYLQGL